MEISETAKKEIKRVLEELYCDNCDSEQCAICKCFRLYKIDDALENIEACLEM